MAQRERVRAANGADWLAFTIRACLDNAADGIDGLATNWRARRDSALVATAIEHLRDKFATVDSFGPRQVAAFHDATTPDDRDMHARRAFELVRHFLDAL